MTIREAIAKQIADSKDGGAGILLLFALLLLCGTGVAIAALVAHLIESGCL